jgi:hypothetical protein
MEKRDRRKIYGQHDLNKPHSEDEQNVYTLVSN